MSHNLNQPNKDLVKVAGNLFPGVQLLEGQKEILRTLSVQERPNTSIYGIPRLQSVYDHLRNLERIEAQLLADTPIIINLPPQEKCSPLS